MSWLYSLLIFSMSIFIVSQLLPGIRIRGFGTAIVMAIVYGVLKFFLYWILVVLSLPFILLSLGLFLFVINAFLLWLAHKLIDGIQINGFFTALLASVFISLLDVVLHRVLPGI